MLAVSRTASEAEIKSAYRKMALQFHPDRNPGDAASEERFKECSEAYSVLIDSDKRAAYDRYGHDAPQMGGFGGFETIDFGDIFGEMFGFNDLFGGGRGRRTRSQRGGDLREDLSLSFEEAVFGAERKVNIRRREPCEQCRGTGSGGGKAPAQCRQCGGRGQVRYQQGFFSVARTCPACQGMGSTIEDPCKRCRGEGLQVREHTLEVKVPAGVEEGTRVLYSGQGDAGAHGGHAGDVYIVLHVKEHQFFERDGKDLHCAVPVSFIQAALGAEIRIPTLEGEATIRLPEGTQTGTVFRLRNKGVPVLNGHGRGDIFVEVKVQTPTKLSKQQRDLLKALESTLGVENKPERRSLMAKVKDIFS